jgi:phosphonate degradation associated HDIG domain protein
MKPSGARIIEELASLFELRAGKRYGLASISQRAHGLQAADLARKAGLSEAMVVAALLHDIGHMVHSLGEHPASQGVDDRHEVIGADWLEPWFGQEVTEPIRLHVQAKRYLCSVEPGYFQGLSPDSAESLVLQGGGMSDTEVAAFRMTPGWKDAVALRRIDECAKDPAVTAPGFEEFVASIRSCMRR